MYVSKCTAFENTLFKEEALHTNIIFEMFYQVNMYKLPMPDDALIASKGYSYREKMIYVLYFSFDWRFAKIPYVNWSSLLRFYKEKAKIE